MLNHCFCNNFSAFLLVLRTEDERPYADCSLACEALVREIWPQRQQNSIERTGRQRQGIWSLGGNHGNPLLRLLRAAFQTRLVSWTGAALLLARLPPSDRGSPPRLGVDGGFHGHIDRRGLGRRGKPGWRFRPWWALRPHGFGLTARRAGNCFKGYPSRVPFRVSARGAGTCASSLCCEGAASPLKRGQAHTIYAGDPDTRMSPTRGLIRTRP